VIVGFNGQAIADPGQFSRLVADAKVGTTATLKVLRNGKPIEFKLAIVSTSRGKK
jgi:S1-C subfamily serine protease